VVKTRFVVDDDYASCSGFESVLGLSAEGACAPVHEQDVLGGEDLGVGEVRTGVSGLCEDEALPPLYVSYRRC
jgi:hypothetical protein